MGQYTQVDPIGLVGGNPTLYGYAFNPFHDVDPLGLLLNYIFDFPSNPNQLLNDGWQNITHPSKASNTNMMDLLNPNTGQHIEFHPKSGSQGWSAVDHYHVHNPNATNKGNALLNSSGQPVPDGSHASHITPNDARYQANRASQNVGRKGC